MYIKIAKTRDVTSPLRANWGDALDFYVPNDFEEQRIMPDANLVIPAGIKVEVPFGYALMFVNKSGVASKLELMVGACLIDHGYAGEVHIDLHNVGLNPQKIVPGMKIIQGIIIPVQVPTVVEVDETELYKDVAVVSGRGTGGFGSTGI